MLLFSQFMDEKTGTEKLRDCPRSNLLLPATGPPVWLGVYLLLANLKQPRSQQLSHRTRCHFQLQLVFVSTSSAFSEMSFILWFLSFFPFPLLLLCAVACNCDGDKGIFFKVIEPKSVVFSNLHQIIHTCDNPQALHTLQHQGWEGFTSTRAETNL